MKCHHIFFLSIRDIRMPACAREIKNIKTLYATLTASGRNLMRASMDEKLELVNTLHSYISNMLGIIDSANLWCSIVAMGGFLYDYIWDILNSDVKDEIAKKVIDKRQLLPYYIKI